MQLAKKIGGGSYSTSEIDTGETWIDGKKIYKKSFIMTKTSSTDRQSIDVSACSIDMLVKSEGTWMRTNGEQNPIINANHSASYCLGAYLASSSSFILTWGDSIKPYLITAYVTLFYTKT